MQRLGDALDGNAIKGGTWASGHTSEPDIADAYLREAAATNPPSTGVPNE